MPSRSHHTDSLLSPYSAWPLANGVGADRPRQAEFSKGALEHGEGVLRLRGREEGH
jgi:hypothetical protein